MRTTAKLFDQIPRGLFGPLGDPYAELYWDLLADLYQYEFEREPFLVLRQSALEIAEQVILARLPCSLKAAYFSFSLPKEKAKQIAHALLAAAAGIDQTMECSFEEPKRKTTAA